MFCEDFLIYSLDESLSLRDEPLSHSNSKFAKIGLVNPALLRDEHGNTPLHHAVIDQNCTLLSVKKHLERLFINAKNFLWHTPLHCIIMSNCQKIDVIQLLLRKGAYINAKDRNGSTVLHKALQNPKCSMKLIDFLIKNKAHLNVKQYGQETPLMFAVRNRNPNLDIVEKLMCKGCIDVCAKHTENHNTLRILCSDLALIKMFLQYSFYIDDSEDNYLQDESIIDFSCPNSACGFKSLEGRSSKCTDLATSLLMYAVKFPSYNMDVIKELLKKGACIYSKNCMHDCAFDYALRNPRCSLQLIRELLRFEPPGTHWNFVALVSDSFLHIAAANRNCPVEVMKLLMLKDKCRSLNQDNPYHLSPLDCAADMTQDTCCNLDVVEAILIKGGSTCKDSSIDMSVLWKNIQVLASPDADRNVLDCTKLLVKYALVDKMRTVHDAYACITKMCARFRRRDKFGYFEELTSHLNACFTEVMSMMEMKLSYYTFFQFAFFLSCSLNDFVDKMNNRDTLALLVSNHIPLPCVTDIAFVDKTNNQDVFTLLVCNQFPLYHRLVVSLLKKKVLADYMFDMLMYTTNEEGYTVNLNSYCIDGVVRHLQNEDVFNLYVAFVDQNDIDEMNDSNPMQDERPEHLLLYEADSEREESTCCCIIPPKKKCRLH